MRASRGRAFWFSQCDFADNLASDEVELRYSRRIPQRDVTSLAVIGNDRCVGKGARNALGGGNVDAKNNLAVSGIEEQRFIGLVAGDEDTFFAGHIAYTDAGGVSNILELVAANLSARKRKSRRERQQFLRRNFSLVKRIDSDAVAGVVFFLA